MTPKQKTLFIYYNSVLWWFRVKE